jgi:Asp-tRNA(Asn)/Glu-tRNA(Gln) amidotransferase A subunit family amidase
MKRLVVFDPNRRSPSPVRARRRRSAHWRKTDALWMAASFDYRRDVLDFIVRWIISGGKHFQARGGDNCGTDTPEYKDFIENIMPRATNEKLAVFENHGVDALVFPYVPTFAQPIKNPIYTIDDPAFVKSDAPVAATMSGYSSAGFPSIVVPMGFGSQGLPMTITFFGKPYEEKKIIGFAYAYEQASKMRRPSPLVPPLEGETINYATK